MTLTATLTSALTDVGVPAHAITPDSRWRDGVWIANTGPLARDGQDVLGEDVHGNTIGYPDLDVAVTQLAVRYWLDVQVSPDKARTLLPRYRRARAWFPDGDAGQWWSLVVEEGWRNPGLGPADIVAALPEIDREGGTPDNPIAVMLGTTDEAVVVHVMAWAPQQGGWCYPVLQPSQERQIHMHTLLAVARHANGREAMTDAVQQHVQTVVEETRRAALSALRDRFHAREQWTLVEAAAYCGITTATARSYRERLQFPAALPYWAINRDAGQQSVVDAEQVRTWQVRRPGQGTRTDLRARA